MVEIPEWIKEIEKDLGRELTIEEVKDLVEYGTTDKNAIAQAELDDPMC